jgi:hypothetical protein
MIEWNTITWYSRLAAIVFFVGILPVLNFYIGVQYQQTTAALERSAEAQLDIQMCPTPPQIKAQSVSPIDQTDTVQE